MTALQNTDSNTTYHLVGFAAFVLTGYSLPGLNANPGSVAETCARVRASA